MGQITRCKKIKRLALLLAILVIVEVQPIYFWEFGTPGTLEVKSSKNFTTQVDKPCGKESPDTVDIQ